VTIIPPPALQQALDEVARKQGTTAESVAVTLLTDLLLPSAEKKQEAGIPAGGSLADRISYYIGAIDSGEYVPNDAQSSGSEYGKSLLKRHREGYP
jgi:hypothetical protein